MILKIEEKKLILIKPIFNIPKKNSRNNFKKSQNKEKKPIIIVV